MNERYVDVGWLIADLGLKDRIPLEIEDIRTVIDWLENFPTVDIVKCGECKFLDKTVCARYTMVSPTDDDFCSRGERK